MPPTDANSDLRQKLTHAEAVIVELRGVVVELRKQVEAQQAHIHRLVCATATRHRINPWAYLRDVLDQLAGRTHGDNMGDLLPDTWTTHGEPRQQVGR